MNSKNVSFTSGTVLEAVCGTQLDSVTEATIDGPACTPQPRMTVGVHFDSGARKMRWVTAVVTNGSVCQL